MLAPVSAYKNRRFLQRTDNNGQTDGATDGLVRIKSLHDVIVNHEHGQEQQKGHAHLDEALLECQAQVPA